MKRSRFHLRFGRDFQKRSHLNPWRKRGTASRVHVALVGNAVKHFLFVARASRPESLCNSGRDARATMRKRPIPQGKMLHSVALSGISQAPGGTPLRHEGRAVKPWMDVWLPALSLAYAFCCDFRASLTLRPNSANTLYSRRCFTRPTTGLLSAA